MLSSRHLISHVQRRRIVSGLGLGVLSFCCVYGVRAGVFRAEDGGRVIAESARIRAVFRAGRLISLTDPQSGDRLLAPSSVDFPSARGLPAVGPSAAPDQVGTTVARDARTVTFSTRSQHETIRWKVEFTPDDRGLVLVTESERDPAGLEAVELALPGPDWSRLQLALPVGAQGLTVRDPPAGTVQTFRYCAHRQWEAQLAIFEPLPTATSAPNRPASGFCVWAEDSDFILKRFVIDRRDGANLLRLITETEGDPAQVRRARSVRWHIEVFRGDWRAPAARYREWMVRTFRPPGWKPPDWTRNIEVFVKIGRSLDPGLLAPLARQLDPHRTLLVLPDWRKSGYDQNYPDYTPSPAFPAFCREAHRLGFRLMVHFSTFGCSPYNPAWKRLKPYVLRDRAGRLQGWRLNQKENPQRHFEIHPGAAAYRRILAESMHRIRQRYVVDAFHLDVSLKLVNPKSGRVEGLNVGQAKQRLFRELVRAVPGAAFGGEELNESAFGIFSFVQRTPFDDPRRLDHPVGVYLFGGQVKYYSHYSRTPAATDSNARTGDFLRVWSPAGMYPTFSAGSGPELDGPCARILCRVGRTFQKYGLAPAPDAVWPWPPDVRFIWRERTPRRRLWRAVVTDSGARLECETETAWREQTGLSAVGPNWNIPGWPVADEHGISGLNPIQPYVLIPGAPTPGTPRFLRFPPEMTLNRWELTSGVIEAEIVPNRRTTAVAVLTEMTSAMHAGILFHRSERQLDAATEDTLGHGAVWERRPVLSGAIRMPGFEAHPPWKDVPGESRDAAVFAEFRVALPAEKTASGAGLVLDWFAGMLNPSRGSDGVTYEVEVDGRKVFQKHVARKGWQWMQCPLDAFARRTVSLRLITTPGPAGNTTWDLCGWGDPVIRRSHVRGKIRLRPLHPPMSVTDQHGRSIRPEQLQNNDFALPCSAPCRLTVRCAPGAPVPAFPCDLAGLPYAVGRYGPVGAWHPVPPGSGVGERKTMSAGGSRYPNAVFAHPPHYGRTVLQWVIGLPDAPDLGLNLGYGIAGKFSKGVSFQALVDGRTVWRDDMTACGHRTSSVALAEFAGRDVVLELVTDSMGPADFDWAFWSRLELTGRPRP